MLDKRERVRQFYVDYLDLLYGVELARQSLTDANWWGQRLDFVVALSAGLGGATGVAGSMLKQPVLGVACGAISIAAIIVSAYKSSFQLPERIKFEADRMSKLSGLATQSRALWRDVQAYQNWEDTFEQRYQELQKLGDGIALDPYPEPKLEVRERIQDQITTSLNPQQWWKPDAANSSAADQTTVPAAGRPPTQTVAGVN